MITTPAVTLIPPGEHIEGRPWSFSAAHTYAAQCPRKWSYTYGPHRMRMVDDVTSAGRKRGTVLHHAVGAAFQLAADDAAQRPETYPATGTMTRYLPRAREALNEAWIANAMPHDREMVHQVLGVLTDLLAAQSLPALGSIVEVEQRHTLRTAAGLPFVVIIDLVKRWRRGLTVRDWKYGSVDKRDPATDRQTGLYVAALSTLHPDIARFTGEFYSMSRRELVSAEVDADGAAAALAWLESTAAAAEADPDPEPRPGPQCSYCPFQRICPGPKMAPVK